MSEDFIKQRSKKLSPAGKKSQGSASVRIIGGQWRSRKLPVLDQTGLRPTGDRMRETLFNWLMPYLPNARCLDAFAGSGALGFEALSRGAAFVQFIECDGAAAGQLRENCRMLDCHDADIDCTDFVQWRPGDKGPFDIVFLDPPFAADLWQDSIDHLNAFVDLTPGALVYMEAPRDKTISPPLDWQTFRQKATGQIQATLYKTSASHPG